MSRHALEPTLRRIASIQYCTSEMPSLDNNLTTPQHKGIDLIRTLGAGGAPHNLKRFGRILT